MRAPGGPPAPDVDFSTNDAVLATAGNGLCSRKPERRPAQAWPIASGGAPAASVIYMKVDAIALSTPIVKPDCVGGSDSESPTR
jgi:hypothetical protein